jgi:broad specificity phosphatase PhoE
VLNADGRLRGHLDPPLDEVGRAEVEVLARLLSDLPVVGVVTSPLRRAVQTAQRIAEECGIVVGVDERLIDRDYGRWAGRRVEQVIAEWGSVDAAVGVEDAAVVVARARAVLDDQAGALDAGSVVLVSHDAVNRCLLSSLDAGLGPAVDLPQRTACFNMLSRVRGGWRVDRVDEKAAG